MAKKQSRAVTPGRPPFTFTGSLGKIVDKLGGDLAAAEVLAARLGVTYKTLQRYGAERLEPSRPVRNALRAIAKEYRIADPFPEGA